MGLAGSPEKIYDPKKQMPSARLGTEIEMETSRKRQSNTVARAVKAVYELHCGWWSTEQRGGCLGEHPTPPTWQRGWLPRSAHWKHRRGEGETRELSFTWVLCQHVVMAWPGHRGPNIWKVSLGWLGDGKESLESTSTMMKGEMRKKPICILEREGPANNAED